MVEPIIIVAGLGRCGTSLVMQMLAAGGVPMVGGHPDFEDMAVDHQRHSDPVSWAARCAGRAVKVLDPQHVPLPQGPRYLAIWLTRDPEQQARSQIKLLGGVPTRQMRRAFSQSIRRDEPRGQRAMYASGADTLSLFFEGLLRDPIAAAERIIAHVGSHRFAAGAAVHMASVVIPRGPSCLPGMLANWLIAGAAA